MTFPISFHTFALVSSIFGAGAVLAWRVRETQTPVTTRKILIPPLGMATGFSMFFYPPARIPLLWGLVAFLVGALVFSYPLARTSTLTKNGRDILMKRSRAFILILLALVAVRFALKSYVEHLISPIQTGAIFFVLAFGMILRWRVEMFFQYRKLRAEIDADAPPALSSVAN